MVKCKKFILVSVISAMLLLGITTVFAVTLNIDIIDTVKEYLEMIRDDNSQKASQQLEKKKNLIIKDILDYAKQYKADLTNELDAYGEQEILKAESELEQSFDGIKDELDANKQQLLDEYKEEIGQAIREQKELKEEELQQELSDDLEAVFSKR